MTDIKDNSSANERKDNTVVRVMLEWAPNTNHIGLYVAEKRGYFLKRNLSVEILPVEILPTGEYHSTSVDYKVAEGKVDFGISFQEGITLARASKDAVPVVAVAAIIQHNTVNYASLASSNIHTPRDWVGKKCGAGACISRVLEETTITELLTPYGYTAKDILFEPVRNLYFLPGLQQRVYDFVEMFEGWEGIEASINGITLRTIALRDMNPVFDTYTPTLITSEDYLKNNNETARKFVQSVKEGYKWAIAHPEESALILYEYENTLDLNLVKKSMEYLAPRFQDDAEEWGVMDDIRWKRYTQLMQKTGLIDSSFKIEGAYTNSLLQE